MSIDWTPLDAYVREAETIATVGVSIIAPGGEHWGHRGEEQCPAASTAKIPIMIEIYRKIDRGEVTLNDLHTVRLAEHAPGSGVLQHLRDGLELSVSDLLYLMIAISDNTATNILIETAGMATINETMQALGMGGSILGRPMLGRLAIAGEQENLATPEDYTHVLLSAFDHRAASSTSCDAMLETLQRQQNNRRIGRFVPNDGRYCWGLKNGTNNGIVNDVGFVCGPAGALIIAVYVRGVPDEASGETIVSHIARCAMQATGIVTA